MPAEWMILPCQHYVLCSECKTETDRYFQQPVSSQRFYKALDRGEGELDQIQKGSVTKNPFVLYPTKDNLSSNTLEVYPDGEPKAIRQWYVNDNLIADYKKLLCCPLCKSAADEYIRV